MHAVVANNPADATQARAILFAHATSNDVSNLGSVLSRIGRMFSLNTIGSVSSTTAGRWR
jgi:hypothetical protein